MNGVLVQLSSNIPKDVTPYLGNSLKDKRGYISLLCCAERACIIGSFYLHGEIISNMQCLE